MQTRPSSAPSLRTSHPIPLCALAAVLVLPPATAFAVDVWTEIKSPHLTVIANGGTGQARTLTWKLEQMRSALAQILPWSRVDLDRPFLVLALDNEQKMRNLLPWYWERSGGVRPASVWVTGDKHYLAIRSDLRGDDRQNLNPHMNAYFSYASLIVQQSLEAEIPPWFTRGLAGVLSNTIVKDAVIEFGAPIPWHLQYLRDGQQLRLQELVSVTSGALELKSGEGLTRFDAQAWAFVHFLMFADNAARAPKLNQFFRLVTSGTAADVALAEAIGSIRQLESDFNGYVQRSVFQFARLNVDASVKRDTFAERALPPAEAASALALFHAAMRRPVEARAAIAEARKSGAPAPDSYFAEALLLRGEDKASEAQAALTRAIAEGTTNALAYVELARLQWRPEADRTALAEREKLLTRAVTLNPQYAWAFAMLADVHSLMEAGDAFDLAARAVKLEPSEPEHRLTAARILARLGRHADALRTIEAALKLPANDDVRQRAQELRQWIERQKPPA